jgi:hypothetical protein
MHTHNIRSHNYTHNDDTGDPDFTTGVIVQYPEESGDLDLTLRVFDVDDSEKIEEKNMIAR